MLVFAKLVLGGAFGLARKAGAALARLNIWQLLCIALFASTAIFYVQRNSARAETEQVRIDLNEVRAERDSLISAAKEAERLNKEQVKRIVSEQDRISDNVEADLNARIERLRRELRAKADNGNSQGSNPSPDGNPSEVPADPSRVCISSEQFLLGAEYEEKLDQWVKWWNEVSKVQR